MQNLERSETLSSDTTKNKQNDVIEKVETFIQRLNDMDLVYTDRASEVKFGEKSIADGLALAITTYEEFKNSATPTVKHDFASTCLLWIERAWAWKAIEEGEGLARKLRECQAENTKLRTDNETLASELLQVKQRLDGLLKRIPSLRSDNEGSDDSGESRVY